MKKLSRRDAMKLGAAAMLAPMIPAIPLAASATAPIFMELRVEEFEFFLSTGTARIVIKGKLRADSLDQLEKPMTDEIYMRSVIATWKPGSDTADFRGEYVCKVEPGISDAQINVLQARLVGIE